MNYLILEKINALPLDAQYELWLNLLPKEDLFELPKLKAFRKLSTEDQVLQLLLLQVALTSLPCFHEQASDDSSRG